MRAGHAGPQADWEEDATADVDPRTDEAVAAWFRADAARLLTYLPHRSDPETAQDALQETLAVVYRKRAEIPDPATR